MYKSTDNSQSTFLDFNQPLGLHMNPENRWIKMADMVPWDVFEKKYRRLFKSQRGNIAKPLRMALGALIIQTRFSYSDRELVEQITENPYLQYFVGLPGYQETSPFDATTLVLFRKRINHQMLMEVNEYLLDPDKIHREREKQENEEPNDPKDPPSGDGGGQKDSFEDTSDKDTKNEGTLTLDATCAPVYIRYPQDVSLLNEAREKLEAMLLWFHKRYGIGLPRRDCKAARKNYLAYAKSKKHTQKQIRNTLRKQLAYVRRDLGYLDDILSNGYAPRNSDIRNIITIHKLYEQQRYMYEHNTHKVENRIVSIHEPWVRPIVRGKVKTPTEFGAKLDLSIDTEGYARIEKVSFDAYNEGGNLIEVTEAFYRRTGRYPERILADQIYRTRENRRFCKEHGIRISGPKLGRPSEDKEENKQTKQQEYQDNTDRIEIERRFSQTKRCYGMGKIVTRLEETQLTSIALSVFVANLFRKMQRTVFALLRILGFFNKSEGTGSMILEFVI